MNRPWPDASKDAGEAPTSPLAPAQGVVDFWRHAGPKHWFAKNDILDRLFAEHFMSWHEAAADGQLADWLEHPTSALALILLLDQFPRNVFRGTPRMYGTDVQARLMADKALARGHDQAVQAPLRLFFYLPFTHSETLADQQRSLRLQEPLGMPYVQHAREHLEIVERFGRFPHRNAILGRTTTPPEQAFLDEGGFAG